MPNDPFRTTSPADRRRVQRWTVAIGASLVAASCLTPRGTFGSAWALVAFVTTVVMSALYGGLVLGLTTAVGGWAISNVFFLPPVGELSFHREAVMLLGAYVVAAAIGFLARSASVEDLPPVA